jgi:hypothetical protein
LTGLILLVLGTVLFCVFARPRLQAPGRVDLQLPLDTPGVRAKVRQNTLLLGGGVLLAALGIFEIARLSYSIWTVGGWLLGIAIVGVALWRYDRLCGIDLRPHLTRVDVVMLVGLTGFAVAVLFYRLGSVPDSLWPDEGNFFFMSRDIAEGRWQPPIFAAGTYTFPVLGNYFQAAVFEVLGSSLATWRASSAISVLPAVPALYLLGRHIVGRPLAVGAVVLLVTSPHLIALAVSATTTRRRSRRWSCRCTCSTWRASGEAPSCCFWRRRWRASGSTPTRRRGWARSWCC